MKLLLLVVLTSLAACTTAQQGDPKTTDSCGHECSSHAECPAESACISHNCTDPCQGTCGDNSICKVVNHVATCACNPGYTGDPYYKCDPQSGATCADSWPPVSGGTKKFWIETVKKADWTEAVMFCMQRGMRLASLQTRNDSINVKDLLESSGIRDGRFWLAGTDHLYEGDWTWFTTNEPFEKFTNWLRNEPNNSGDEDCLELCEFDRTIGYSWNDSLCDRKKDFICEYFE